MRRSRTVDPPTPEHRPEADLRTAAENLFAENCNNVFAFCLMRCGSRTLAEDISAEVFTDAVRRLRNDPTVILTQGWLITVARRRLIDHWRRTARERRRAERLSMLRIADDYHDTNDESVIGALESLSDRQRLALILRYLDELSVSEVADAMEMTYTATESLLARSRRSFARSYTTHNRGGSPQ